MPSIPLPAPGAASPSPQQLLQHRLHRVEQELERLQVQMAALQATRVSLQGELNAPAGAVAAAGSGPARWRVLLVTYDWSTLAEMPFVLKQAACEVDVLCPHYNAAVKNGFYDRWIDAGVSMDALLHKLRALAAQGDYDYILIGDDPIQWRIYREKMTDLMPLLPILNPDALQILGKLGFAEHCHANGVLSPAFYPVRQRADADQALRQLGLPLVVKDDFSNGGAGVRIFGDAPSYFAFMDGYAFAEPLLAQQFIDGEVLGVDALFKRGQLLRYACSIDLEPTLGPSTKRRYFPNDEQIGALLGKLGASALLHGFANVSILREAGSQRCYLIEADPRPTKWVSYARWFGNDFASSFHTFMAAGGNVAAPADGRYEQVDCWEVEYFPNYAARLINEGRNQEALRHLVDFQKNYRYTVYDPVLLRDKMECILNGLKFLTTT